jgi:hypothetical protein
MGKIKNYLRHVRTTPERRRWFADDVPLLRRSRAPTQLPSYWSDIWRWPQRTWKKHRRTKYRKIVEM